MDFTFDWSIEDQYEYSLLSEYVTLSNYGKIKLEEFSLPSGLKERLDFIKITAKETGFKIKDLFKLFLNKYIFKFFNLVGWSFLKLFELVKNGMKLYANVQKVIAEFIHKHTINKFGAEELRKLDSFLKTHPKIKMISGIAVASLLLYIWFSMSFTGDFLDDFDVSMIFISLAGNYSLYKIFGTPEGAKLLVLFATGALAGLTFPWLSASSNLTKFIVAVITTLGKYAKQKISKGKEDVDKEMKQYESVNKCKPYKSFFKVKLKEDFFDSLSNFFKGLNDDIQKAMDEKDEKIIKKLERRISAMKDQVSTINEQVDDFKKQIEELEVTKKELPTLKIIDTKYRKKKSSVTTKEQKAKLNAEAEKEKDKIRAQEEEITNKIESVQKLIDRLESSKVNLRNGIQKVQALLADV